MKVVHHVLRYFKQPALSLAVAGSAHFCLGTVKQPVWADDRDRKVQVLLIRHGESTGNKVFDNLDKRLQELQRYDHKLFLQEISKLLPDPDVPLSPRGEFQAERLRGYAPLLTKCAGPGGKVCVFVSPMQRACQTAAPLVAELRERNSCRVWVKDDIYEVGGMSKVVDGPDPIIREQRTPPPGLSAKQIRERFDYDTALMAHTAEDLGWCNGIWESDSEGRERAAAVAQWLRSDEFYKFCKAETSSDKDPLAVLVSHGWFLNCLLHALLAIEADSALDKLDRNGPEKQASFFVSRNTAVGRIVIQGNAPRQVFVMGLGSLEHLWSTPQALPGQLPVLHLPFKETLHTKPGA